MVCAARQTVGIFVHVQDHGPTSRTKAPTDNSVRIAYRQPRISDLPGKRFSCPQRCKFNHYESYESGSDHFVCSVTLVFSQTVVFSTRYQFSFLVSRIFHSLSQTPTSHIISAGSAPLSSHHRACPQSDIEDRNLSMSGSIHGVLVFKRMQKFSSMCRSFSTERFYCLSQLSLHTGDEGPRAFGIPKVTILKV